jgi:hypothetical protein
MLAMLRVLIDDLDAITYTDLKLQKILATAANLVQQDAAFSVSYTVSPTTPSISPDPNTDMQFQNLVTLKAACILMRAEAKIAAAKGFYIADQGTTIDSRSAAESLKNMANSYCDDYNGLLQDYVLTGYGNMGTSIVTPITSRYTGRR